MLNAIDTHLTCSAASLVSQVAKLKGSLGVARALPLNCHWDADTLEHLRTLQVLATDRSTRLVIVTDRSKLV